MASNFQALFIKIASGCKLVFCLFLFHIRRR
jgi:hypothetical protein